MRILYLFPREFYDRKMSLGRVLYGEAVARQPGVTLKFWGDGWPGYDSDLTLAENLRIADDEPWDFLWHYKSDRLKGVESTQLPALYCFNECHGEGYIREALNTGASLVCFHHESDQTHHEARLQAMGIKSVHLLHCAPEAFYEPRRRSIDCLVTGVMSQDIYPIRFRFKKLVESGQLPGVVRKHPGYRLNCHADLRRQYSGYARQLCESKVALACTSRHRYALAKTPEAMMAGCCVVTDTPDDDLFRQHFQPGVHYVEVRPEWSDNDIVRVVRRVLDNGDWERIGNAARAVVLEKFTTDRYAERLVGEMRSAVATSPVSRRFA